MLVRISSPSTKKLRLDISSQQSYIRRVSFPITLADGFAVVTPDTRERARLVFRPAPSARRPRAYVSVRRKSCDDNPFAKDLSMQLVRILLSIGLALAVASWPSVAEAQFDAATVLGRVLDESGGAMPGATVTLTSKSTNIAVTATADDTGGYQFLNVRVGDYTIEAQLQGFAVAKTDVTVTVGARQRVDLSLKVGGIGESIEVTGASRVLETESSDRGQVIAHEQIVNLPLNGRAYADLALLSPGVRPSAIGTSRDASFNVNGMRSALNNFILDGIDNNSYGTSNQGFSNQVVQVSPDAVEEFKVVTNNFSAEYGRAGGAVINATFRSGTNAFHGTAWEFHRNDSLNATGFFKPSAGKPRDGAQPVRRRVRRSDHPQPLVLLRELRRLSPGTEHGGVLEPADGSAAPGQHGQGDRQSADRRGLCQRRHPAVGDHAVRARGAGGPAAADAPGHLEQLRHAADPDRREQQVRHQGRSADLDGHERASSVSAIAS